MSRNADAGITPYEQLWVIETKKATPWQPLSAVTTAQSCGNDYGDLL